MNENKLTLFRLHRLRRIPLALSQAPAPPRRNPPDEESPRAQRYFVHAAVRRARHDSKKALGLDLKRNRYTSTEIRCSEIWKMKFGRHTQLTSPARRGDEVAL